MTSVQFQPVLAYPPAASFTFGQAALSTTVTNAYSFGSMNLGTATADRIIVVGIVAYPNVATYNITSVTIGGITANAIVDNGSSTTAQLLVGMYAARVPTGTTGTVAVNFNVSANRCGIATTALYGVGSLTPVATYSLFPSQANPMSRSISAPPGSVAVSVSTANNGSTAGTYTWAGLTENYDSTISGSVTQSGAAAAFTTNQSGLTVSETYTQVPNTDGGLAIGVFR